MLIARLSQAKFKAYLDSKRKGGKGMLTSECMVQNYEPVTFEEVLENYAKHRQMFETGRPEWTSDEKKAEGQNA